MIIASCTSHNSVVSESITAEGPYKYSDSESMIGYRISNDNSTLTLRMATHEKSSIMKILRTGLTVYFDPSGKKKKTIAIKYPSEQKGQQLQKEKGQKQTENKRPGQIPLEEMIQKAPDLILYMNKDTTIHYSRLTNPPVNVKLSTIHEGELTYELTIPIQLISSNGLDNISIGVESGSFDPLSASDSPQAGNGGRPSGGRGGSSGTRPGGGGGRTSGNGNPTSTENSKLLNPIKFWFQLKLNPE